MEPPVENDPDPLVAEYAETLKQKLGDNYTDDLDGYDIRERINIMKHMVKVAPKSSKQSPFPKPVPQEEQDSGKNKLRIRGMDWRKYRNE